MSVLLNMRPDLEVEPNLNDHLLHLRKGNQRPRSIRERRLTVLRVARYLGHPVAEVTREELIAWQDDRIDHLKPSGMHNEIVHVSQYLAWLTDAERRVDNPARALVRPRHVQQRHPSPIKDADLERALAAADQPIHAWLGLAAFCGLRCVEIASLAREDIRDSPNGSYLRIIGKGGKERDVTLPDELRTELESSGFNSTGHLFNRMDGKPGPPTAMRVSERINDFLHSLGIKATAHKMRHRFGTKLYAQTNDPFFVADQMGHASTDTTRLYVQVVDNRARAAAQAIMRLDDGKETA